MWLQGLAQVDIPTLPNDEAEILLAMHREWSAGRREAE